MLLPPAVDDQQWVGRVLHHRVGHRHAVAKLLEAFAQAVVFGLERFEPALKRRLVEKDLVVAAKKESGGEKEVGKVTRKKDQSTNEWRR